MVEVPRMVYVPRMMEVPRLVGIQQFMEILRMEEEWTVMLLVEKNSLFLWRNFSHLRTSHFRSFSFFHSD